MVGTAACTFACLDCFCCPGIGGSGGNLATGGTMFAGPVVPCLASAGGPCCPYWPLPVWLAWLPPLPLPFFVPLPPEDLPSLPPAVGFLFQHAVAGWFFPHMLQVCAYLQSLLLQVPRLNLRQISVLLAGVACFLPPLPPFLAVLTGDQVVGPQDWLRALFLVGGDSPSASPER